METLISPDNVSSSPAKYPFEKAKDGRGREVDGLWVRNGRFYQQMRLPGKKSPSKVPLFSAPNVPVKNVSEAIAARNQNSHNLRQGEAPAARRTQTFDEYQQHYIKWLRTTGAKSPLTVKKEASALKLWAEEIGSVRLNQIDVQMINDYVLMRKEEDEVSNRTANLDIQALKNCLEYAKKEGILQHKLPTDDWTRLKYTAPKRKLITQEMIDALCNEALRRDAESVLVYENGELVADYIKLLAASGIRRQAGLTARWDNVDWNKRQFTVFTKFDKKVVIDFNARLEAHLTDMHARRMPDEAFIFPSPRTNKKGEKSHIVTLNKTFVAIREKVGLPHFKLHDLRSYFASWCVMSGLPFMTIATFLGHSDGGLLVGKVYGHLNDKHQQEAARQIKFNGTPAPAPAPAPKTALDQMSVEELMAALQKKISQSPGTTA